MTSPSRNLARAARRLADQQGGRLSELPTSRRVIATVTAIETGAGAGGTARVTVTWRGTEVVAAGYAANYTPLPGDRVVCDLIDNQLLVDYPIVGQR